MISVALCFSLGIVGLFSKGILVLSVMHFIFCLIRFFLGYDIEENAGQCDRKKALFCQFGFANLEDCLHIENYGRHIMELN